MARSTCAFSRRLRVDGKFRRRSNTSEPVYQKEEARMHNLKLVHHLDSNHPDSNHPDSRRSHAPSPEGLMFPQRAGAEPTPRELEVEDLLCRGYSQENIAAIFGRSVNTISAQALSLYRKRGVHSQVGLLLAFLERKGIFVFPTEEFGCSSHERVSVGAAQ
jgi:DNA-binding CsgD family transcriptional regulator